jgi:REP element-mobilizing transposase RayT
VKFAQDIQSSRRSIRYKGFDYSTPRAYYFTIIVKDRETLFGRIIAETVGLSEAGTLIWNVWDDLPQRFPRVELDEFVVMPNHVHGILWLLDDPTPVGAGLALPGQETSAGLGTASSGVPEMGRASPAPTLGGVMGAFKSLSAKAVNNALRRSGSLWQRNYFERIIRDDQELADVRRYIVDNPARWGEDREYRGG